MIFRAPNYCPVCNHEMKISSLSCDYCQTQIEGSFTTCKLCKLPVEQQEFIEVFLKCRGSIKDVEKELGISYPTVRNRLDGVVQALGYKVQKQDDEEEKNFKQEIISALEKGEISAQEAVRLLRKAAK
ncbi:MAG TPA: DUF2089 domain-containing protein [Methylomusa anaerophila]|uniref:DUF2089 domain-containing protein n=1 Tax=Methylomusa anaerophila TaxID=1930071 RepID=A0A348AQV0_9FIRM|nr:DUF2089 domain-containing protein [Methylomusa anaerophila]BBB93448.1 hypothetical protein MAMMFC1_04165 [Methylomusa anaerophila]HML90302.1 DUF2089 domain-containing protein [Methylomusa anaerophila]